MRARLLSSALEAVLGAVYLDAGLDVVRALIVREFESRVAKLDDQNKFATDYKTRLQEMTQKRHRVVPEYKMVASFGPDHAKRFRYQVCIQDQALGEGEGNSRKSAEQDAARIALAQIEQETEGVSV